MPSCYPGVTPELKKWSGRLDSNQRPPAPKAGALPGCATPRLKLPKDSTRSRARIGPSVAELSHGGDCLKLTGFPIAVDAPLTGTRSAAARRLFCWSTGNTDASDLECSCQPRAPVRAQLARDGPSVRASRR